MWEWTGWMFGPSKCDYFTRLTAERRVDCVMVEIRGGWNAGAGKGIKHELVGNLTISVLLITE